MTENLDTNTAYTIGKFKIILDEKGSLKIIAINNIDILIVKPNVSNSINVESVKP